MLGAPLTFCFESSLVSLVLDSLIADVLLFSVGFGSPSSIAIELDPPGEYPVIFGAPFGFSLVDSD